MAIPVLLNNVDHADLRIAVDYGVRFGDAANQTRVFTTEFEAVQRDYAIVLRRDPREGYAAFALLGLEADENLFLDGERWDARYVPALHRRGPFSIGVPRDGEEGGPMIHVDPEHPRIVADGVPIFRDQGGQAPVLDQAVEALQRIYTGIQQGPALFAALVEAELIAPVTLELTIGDSGRCTIPDCHTIATDRLDALAGATLEQLHRGGHLRAAIWIASSLGNIPHLLDRKLRRDAGR